MANGKKIILESQDGNIIDTSLVKDSDIDFSKLPDIINVTEFDDSVHLVVQNSSALSDILAQLNKLMHNRFTSTERHY